LGIAIAFNGAWLLIAPVWLAATAPLQAAREERYLEMRFGEGYVEYRRRARRWI
jgi:protein-S-isoprenylcysteine O-methyltransferase Ste14